MIKVVHFEPSPVNTVGVNPSLADAHLIVMPHGITFLKVGSRFIEEFAYSVFYSLSHFHRVTFWHIRPLKSFTIFLTAQLHKTNFSLKTNTVFLLVRSSYSKVAFRPSLFMIISSPQDIVTAASWSPFFWTKWDKYDQWVTIYSVFFISIIYL